MDEWRIEQAMRAGAELQKIMHPESVRIIQAIGDQLTRWEVLLMVGLFLGYRLARRWLDG